MEIEELVIENGGQSFQGYDFQQLCEPGVYLFLERGKPLYIGMGSNALARASQTAHKKAHVRESADEIKIFPCKSVLAAKALETILIEKMRPLFNQNKTVGAIKRILGIGEHSRLGQAQSRINS